MFFRTCVAAVAALMATTAHANNRVESRMRLACPDATHIRVQNGSYTAYTSADPDEVRKCLDAAYTDAVTNPFPINMDGIKQATKVRIRADGVIVLE